MPEVMAWTKDEKTYIAILARRAVAFRACDDIRVLWYDTMLEHADNTWPMLGFNVGKKLARMQRHANDELARRPS